MKYFKLIPYILIIFLLLRVVYLNKQNESLRGKTAELSEELKKQTVVYKDKIVYKYRDSEGKAKQEEVYIPSEGKVEILTPKENTNLDLSFWDKIFNVTIKETDGSIILIKNKGFSFAPELAGFYSKEFEVGLQFRLLYWNRYNAGIGFGSGETLYAYGSRTVSDIFPFLRNTSAQIGFGRNLKENENRFLIGINVRL